jgi:hypothetical protein
LAERGAATLSIQIAGTQKLPFAKPHPVVLYQKEIARFDRGIALLCRVREP